MPGWSYTTSKVYTHSVMILCLQYCLRKQRMSFNNRIVLRECTPTHLLDFCTYLPERLLLSGSSWRHSSTKHGVGLGVPWCIDRLAMLDLTVSSWATMHFGLWLGASSAGLCKITSSITLRLWTNCSCWLHPFLSLLLRHLHAHCYNHTELGIAAAVSRYLQQTETQTPPKCWLPQLKACKRVNSLIYHVQRVPLVVSAHMTAI